MDADEREYLSRHRAHDVDALLRRWMRVARRARLETVVLGEAGGYPVLALEGGSRDREGVYLSAGIHGDEPAGALGLVQWAEESVEWLRGQSVFLAPCLNPWGLENNIRLDEKGRDLNRSFEDRKAGALGKLLQRIAGRRFQVAAMLHEDYDARGIYLYELGQRGKGLGEELLAAAEEFIPRHRGQVDGRPTRRGIVRHRGSLEEVVREIDGLPEAIHLAWHHARTSLTFETPSEFSLYARVQAQMAFLRAVMEVM